MDDRKLRNGRRKMQLHETSGSLYSRGKLQTSPTSFGDIDLDRVVWDSEYREEIRRLLLAGGLNEPDS